MGPLMRLLRVPLGDDPLEIQDVDEYFENHPKETAAYKKLFIGPHMNKRVKPVPKTGNMLLNMVERVPPCVGCGGRSRKGAATCTACNVETAYNATCTRLEEAQKRVHQVQETCVSCQKGTPYNEIVCENKQCSNWWERLSSVKQLTDIEDIVARFPSMMKK